MKNQYSIPVVMANPALNERHFLHVTEGADAIIFVVHASGAVGERFGNAVATRSSAGIPVFLVSNNPGDSHGILNADRYGTTEAVLRGGGIPIQKYNINDIPLILDPEWETTEGIKAQKERTRQTLKHTGKTDEQAEEYLNRWDSEKDWLK